MPEPSTGGRTFTEDEHFAVLTAAVQRETAELQTKLTTLTTERDEAVKRVDVLEAEKAALTSERDKTVADFEAFKQDVTERAAITERKDARVERVKAANEQLPDDFFTPERAQRWAEMADEQFESLVADLVAAKGSAEPVPRQTAAFTGGDSPSGGSSKGSLSSFLALRHGASVT